MARSNMTVNGRPKWNDREVIDYEHATHLAFPNHGKNGIYTVTYKAGKKVGALGPGDSVRFEEGMHLTVAMTNQA